MLSIDEYNHEAKEPRDRVRIRCATGGNPDLTVFVHDRSEQLIGLLNLLMKCHETMVRECRNVEFELLTQGGEVDQTPYTVTGFTLRGRKTERELVLHFDEHLALWQGAHSVEEQGSELCLHVWNKGHQEK